jgi:hypothetical protein
MLFVTQQTFVSALRKGIDFFLYGGRNTECEDATRGFGIQAAAERVEKFIEYGCGTHVFTLSRAAQVGETRATRRGMTAMGRPSVFISRTLLAMQTGRGFSPKPSSSGV